MVAALDVFAERAGALHPVVAGEGSGPVRTHGGHVRNETDTRAPGRQNGPAWSRTHTAELDPDTKAGEGASSLTTADLCLDGRHIGSVTRALKPNSTVRDPTADMARTRG